MRIFEKLIAKFKKPEPKVVTTRNLVDYMVNERLMLVPNYNEREYVKARKRTQHQVDKSLK